MPRISTFYGVEITMYFREHGRPHFHASYGEYVASIAIDSLEVLAGVLPRRAMSLVREWAHIHTDELTENWVLARRNEPFEQDRATLVAWPAWRN